MLPKNSEPVNHAELLIQIIIPATICVIALIFAATYAFRKASKVRGTIAQAYILTGLLLATLGVLQFISFPVLMIRDVVNHVDKATWRVDFIHYGIIGIPLVFVGCYWRARSAMEPLPPFVVTIMRISRRQ